MIIFHSAPAGILMLAVLFMALLSKKERLSAPASFCSLAFSSILVILILIKGGTLHEALACVLLPLAFLLPGKEKDHEL